MVLPSKFEVTSRGKDMGTYSVTVAIGSRDGQTFRDVDALVDTGASFSSIPRAILEEMGHVPVGKEEFELADGRVEEMDLAEVPIRIGDKVRTSLCTFRDTSGAILGALTLEQFLLAVDPHNRRLVPARGLMMAQHGKKDLNANDVDTAMQMVEGMAGVWARR